MKKIIFLSAALFMAMSVVSAQDTLRDRDRDRDRTMDQTKIQKRDRIHQVDHLQYLGGKLYRFQNGVRTQVQSQVQLRNGGGVVNPDGTYQLKNQERLQLRSGECLDMDGNRYQNQNMFNQRRMMTQREIQQSQNRIRQEKQKANQNRRTGRNG